MLPPDLGAGAFRNLLTGERLEPARRNDERWLFLAQVFGVCPVGLLMAEDW